MKNVRRSALPFLLTATLLTSLSRLPAEIQVNDSVVTGTIGSPNEEAITKWPEDVQFSATLAPEADPQTVGTTLRNQIATVESLNGEVWQAHSRVVAQTFQIPGDQPDQTLEKIFLLGQASLPGNSPMKFTARLVDLGDCPDLEAYDAGTNLFTDDPAFEITTPADRHSAQVVSFTFTDKHRVTLKKGHTYAFEIVLDDEMNPRSAFTWLRSTRIDPNLPDAPVFFVPFTDSSKSTDPRTALKNRQAFIGIKTSPADSAQPKK